MMQSATLTIVQIALCLITAIGLIGNITVLVVFGFSRNLQNSTNTLIINLAFADLMFLLFCVPITMYSYAKPWPFSDIVCYLTVYLQYVTAYGSVWTLVLLAFDRFLAVVYPLSYAKMRTMRNVTLTCVTLWLIISLCNLPILSTIGVLRFDNESYGTCVDSIEIAIECASKLDATLFFVRFIVGAYVLPLGIICILYLLMIKRLWQCRTRPQHTKDAFKIRKRVARLVFTLILTFAICWLPQNIRYALKAFYYPNPIFWEQLDGQKFFPIQTSIQLLAYANSSINPILYGILSRHFRQGLIRLCHYNKNNYVKKARSIGFVCFD